MPPHRFPWKAYIVWVMTLVMIACAVIIGVSEKVKREEESPDMFYAITAYVSTIDTMKQRTGFTDTRGEEWFLYDRIGDFKLCENVILIFDSNRTDYMYDDEIVQVSPKE